LKIEYEDTFVKVAGLIGGPDYVRVARALLNNENATDEEIASATGLKIKTVRKALYDLFGRSLITGVRVRDPKRGWFVYRWKAQRDQTDGFIQTQKKKVLNRLKLRLEYEENHEFYHCGTLTDPMRTFEDAMESFFKCPACGKPLNRIENSELKAALKWKINQLEEDMNMTKPEESIQVLEEIEEDLSEPVPE
jgi:transcription initiation factor TFIIE subunit alpha